MASLGSVQSVFYTSLQDYTLFPAAGAPAIADQENRIYGNDTRLLLPGGLTAGASYERDTRVAQGQVNTHVIDWGLYVQQELAWGRLSLHPALRMDQHSAFGNIYNPRLTSVYQWTDSLKISGNAARSFRAPGLVDLYVDFPDPFFPFFKNPNLRPETAWSYDLGIERLLSPDARVSLTGYYTRLRDRIKAVSNTTINSPRAELSGVEWEARKRQGPFHLLAAYTFQRAVGNEIGSSKHIPLRLTPRHLASAQITWFAPDEWEVVQTLQYTDKQYEMDGERGVKLPSTTLWNARFSKKILGADLYAAVDNILDKRYAGSFSFSAYYPQPGRTFSLGVNIRFID
jgi:outer membrane receptor protein involved in Fe transport